MVAAAALAVWAGRRGSRRMRLIWERTLALLVLAAWAGEYLYAAATGTWSLSADLPLQLTDAISIVSILALWTRRPRLVELCYLWAMTAALQAVLTPDLPYAFPSPYYFTYFGYHIGAVVAACLLVFGERRYLGRGAVRRAYLIALAWTVPAALANAMTAGNYMYLSSPPAHASILSVFGPWPWYIVATILFVAPALLGAAWLLAAAIERWDRRVA